MSLLRQLVERVFAQGTDVYVGCYCKCNLEPKMLDKIPHPPDPTSSNEMLILTDLVFRVLAFLLNIPTSES